MVSRRVGSFLFATIVLFFTFVQSLTATNLRQNRFRFCVLIHLGFTTRSRQEITDHPSFTFRRARVLPPPSFSLFISPFVLRERQRISPSLRAGCSCNFRHVGHQPLRSLCLPLLRHRIAKSRSNERNELKSLTRSVT